MYTLLHDRSANYYILWIFTLEWQTLCQERRFILDKTVVLTSYVVRPATSTMLIQSAGVIAWERIFLALEDIDVSSCICQNCERDIKKVLRTRYMFHARRKKNICNKKKCIVPMCSCMSNITTTNICTVLDVATMLGFTVDDLDDTPSSSDTL